MLRLTSTTFVAILSLGMAGNVMQSSWTATEYHVPLEFAHPQSLPPVTDQRSHDAVRTEHVRVESSGTALDALLYLPDAAGPHPGIVFVHGAGTKDRTGFAEQARYLAQAGIVSLVLEKRTEGYSPWHRDYEALAGDILAGADYLQSRSDVDADRVGLFGESEGAWIAPIAAANDPSVDFLILVSAPVVSPAEQATYATLMALDGLDVPAPVERAVAQGIGMAMSLPRVLNYAQFDAQPWLARTEQPILMVYGTEDASVPIVEAPETAQAVAGGPVSVRYFDGAQHGIRIGSSTDPFADGYLDTLAAWITGLADEPAAEPAIAGGQPHQPMSAAPAPDAPWYATAYAHIVIIALVVAGYSAGPVAERVAAWRLAKLGAGLNPRDRANEPPAAGRRGLAYTRRLSLRRVRLLGLASISGLVAYFVGLSHLALNHMTNPLVTYGMWAIVWIVTAGAVMALINLWFGPTWRRDELEAGAAGVAARPTSGLTTVEAIALTGVVAGTVLLLLVVTYWGVFLGI